ncbi:cysteine proteinase inhibitor 1 [Aedes aegypti]|uniref:Cystatin n=1 Tax=Aedes aegypti TaxID=7159 RepID=CYT_AEDAE|nr:cysteine proteinase inhibitor 1 [Aedes aegypti]XP_021694028.1 cysteine proteinase inhibitor 1 [Aedes aegypti]
MDGQPITGGVHPTENLNAEHHDFIKAALNETGTHAGRKYKVLRSSQQVVAGMKYTFYIVFEDDESGQEYKITAWSRPWLQDKGEALKLTFDKHEPK